METGNGRRWAYGALILGGTISMTINAMHSLMTPSPIRGVMVTLSALLPILLYVAIEVLTKSPWGRRAAHWIARVLGVLPVAAVTAYVSYRHMVALLLYGGEDTVSAHAWPIAVDGLMVMATFALVLTAPTRQDVSGVSLAERVRSARAAALDVVLAATSQPATSQPATSDVAKTLSRDALPPARKPRAEWDKTEARRLILDSNLTDGEIAARVSSDPDNPVGTRSIANLRNSIRAELADAPMPEIDAE